MVFKKMMQNIQKRDRSDTVSTSFAMIQKIQIRGHSRVDNFPKVYYVENVKFRACLPFYLNCGTVCVHNHFYHPRTPTPTYKCHMANFTGTLPGGRKLS